MELDLGMRVKLFLRRSTGEGEGLGLEWSFFRMLCDILVNLYTWRDRQTK